jgi:hypothetical protein
MKRVRNRLKKGKELKRVRNCISKTFSHTYAQSARCCSGMLRAPRAPRSHRRMGSVTQLALAALSSLSTQNTRKYFADAVRGPAYFFRGHVQKGKES